MVTDVGEVRADRSWWILSLLPPKNRCWLGVHFSQQKFDRQFA